MGVTETNTDMPGTLVPPHRDTRSPVPQEEGEEDEMKIKKDHIKDLYEMLIAQDVNGNKRASMYSPGTDTGPVSCKHKEYCQKGYSHRDDFTNIIADPAFRDHTDNSELHLDRKSVV